MKKFISAVVIVNIISVFVSCKSKMFNDNLEIYGYMVGDTLTEEFNIIKTFGPYYKLAKYIYDSSFAVYTIGNHISSMHLLIKDKDFENIIKRIKNNLGQSTNHYTGDTIFGIKLKHKVEFYYWYDPLTQNKYSTIKNLDKNNVNNLEITNNSIVESLKMKFIENYNGDDIDIKIMDF